MNKNKTYIVFPECQCWGLHWKGDIVLIEMWSTSIIPQELHFKFKKESKWSYNHDFEVFSTSKRALKKYKKLFR